MTNQSNTPPNTDQAPTDDLIITHDSLDISSYLSRVTVPECGATASFVGTVRSPNHGRTVHHIDYQGYEAMMLTQMRVIAHELREAYTLGHIVIAHRLGLLYPGEASIAIVVASPHRREALSACHQCIERVKELLPVWKYEATDQGSVWVEGSSKAAPTLD